MCKYKYEYLIQNSGNTIIRGGEDKFSVGDEVFNPLYEKKTIKSFNIDKDFGIRVDWVEGGHSSLDNIHKTDEDHQLHLAKELLKNNECSIKYKTTGSFRIEGSFHTMQWVAFHGTPDVMIHGEGYIPVKKYVDDVNKALKGKQKPSEDEIIKAKKIVEQSGGVVIDHRKMFTIEDMRKCYDKA